MRFLSETDSPLGKIILASDGSSLTGLWFFDQKNALRGLQKDAVSKDLIVFEEAKKWLKIYFSGKEPDFRVPLSYNDTPFRMEVWKILQEIPYGEVITYSDIAERITKQKGISKMSAQAVGSAVGMNPISILIPCHRVVGKDGDLHGYAGGLERKEKLLKLEQEKPW
ncbi:MAG: methylated-DNA--[Erysipelotrichaceae bacterium]|nr:methylated-DNA--[protein]-cysteine S-methyltransferase [Erysipelotrichaceae bacterium]